MTAHQVTFIGDVVFTDHYMRRLAERYGVKPKRKQRVAAARALLLALTGWESDRARILHAFADGKMNCRLDVGGRPTNSVVAVRDGRAELVTALPRNAYDFGKR